MSFEQPSFRNDDDVAGSQADVVFEIPAVKEIVIIKYQYRLDPVVFPAHVGAFFRGKGADPAGLGDRLHNVELCSHHKEAGLENFTSDKYLRLEILFGDFGDVESNQTDGDINFFGEFAFDSLLYHTGERIGRQATSSDLPRKRKRDHPGRANEDLAIELGVLIDRNGKRVAGL